ncbi:MAG: class I SAM-dependent methyltransferase [Sporichthyaceae bacterium]|nr:class I SAM-dependent methyltransferase [Sporichthyaceae bacterium]
MGRTGTVRPATHPLTGFLVTATIEIDHPTELAAGAGAVWVTHLGPGTVSRIDPATEAVATIKVGRGQGHAAGCPRRDSWRTVRHTASMYSDADAAALYDLLNPWGPSDDFYLSYLLEAPSVLDVGCGTGVLQHRARESGHTGRLCGLDPDGAALDRARTLGDVQWVQGRAADMAWDREFALAVMASNVFQVFVTDEELRASLATTRAALVDGGLLVFGTRNPRVREWEHWNPSNPLDVVDHAGRELRIVYHVESVTDDVVTFTETTATRDGEPLRVDRASLRFLDVEGLDAVLGGAGFEVEAWYGDWSRGPLTPTSDDIIVVARATRSTRPGEPLEDIAAERVKIERFPGWR